MGAHSSHHFARRPVNDEGVDEPVAPLPGQVLFVIAEALKVRPVVGQAQIALEVGLRYDARPVGFVLEDERLLGRQER